MSSVVRGGHNGALLRLLVEKWDKLLWRSGVWNLYDTYGKYS